MTQLTPIPQRHTLRRHLGGALLLLLVGVWLTAAVHAGLAWFAVSVAGLIALYAFTWVLEGTETARAGLPVMLILVMLVVVACNTPHLAHQVSVFWQAATGGAP